MASPRPAGASTPTHCDSALSVRARRSVIQQGKSSAPGPAGWETSEAQVITALMDPGGVINVVSKKPQLRQRTARSEEHTSELQSPCNLVCRLLLEKKKNKVHYAQPA